MDSCIIDGWWMDAIVLMLKVEIEDPLSILSTYVHTRCGRHNTTQPTEQTRLKKKRVTGRTKRSREE